MAKTLLDLPEEAIQRAMQYSGHRTKKDAVSEALREYNQRRAAEEYLEMLRSGVAADLDDPDVMKGAHR